MPYKADGNAAVACRGQQTAAAAGQDPALPVRSSFMNFDEIDPNALNDAVAMLHDIAEVGLEHFLDPRELCFNCACRLSSSEMCQAFQHTPDSCTIGA